MQGGKTMKSRKLFKSIASFALVMAMVAPMTVAPGQTAQAAKKMSLSAKSALLTVGATKSVSVKNAKKTAKFTWKSSNKKVATVTGKTNKATVKGVGAGSAKISCVVKVGKKKSTVRGLTVKVRQEVKSLAMQNTASKALTATSLKPGEKVVLKAAINNNASGSTTNQTVSWSSSNTKVATVKKKNANQATVTALSNGTATITAVVAPKGKDKKTVSCTITVKGEAVATATPKPSKATNTPWKYPDGTIYDQHFDVTRWYNPATAAQSTNKHAHDGYKNNTFAIWMVGFFDNQYSTNEDEYNTTYGPALDDYKEKELHVTGKFMYEGTAQKTVLFQVNYTSPKEYPIIWKWEKGASKQRNEFAEGLKISGNNGSEEAAPDKYYDLDVKFTIPKEAKNGDKDDSTGKNFGIYLYFPNKPGGALAYVKDNTFHFKDFKITYKK